jgi:DNA-binding response OmpR family regulator
MPRPARDALLSLDRLSSNAVSSGLPESHTVLVADDSMTILAMVSSRLSRAGYDVITASRGDDALRLAQESRPQLVLLDVEMPGLDGVEVARRIRADEALAGTFIVLLTSLSEASDVAAGMEAGANAYLTKPFSPQDLQTQVELLIGPPGA